MATPNRLYFGDCLEVMREDISSESVDLIYLDPPFQFQASLQRLHRRGTVGCI